MKINGNTILITGGSSGIGRALAEAFHARDNRVVITGRRNDVLEEVVSANSGMKSAVLDMDDSTALNRFAVQMKTNYPTLNAVIYNAGISRLEQLDNGDSSAAESIIATNLLGPIRLNAALLPLVQSQPQATIMTVSSGLAFVPSAMFPSYCASKAAIHSYTQSLRYQLRNTSVEVLELIPPYVQTELTGAHQANDPRAMPLKDFIGEVMSILEHSPDATEICVERVKAQRFAEASGDYYGFFNRYNDAISASIAATPKAN